MSFFSLGFLLFLLLLFIVYYRIPDNYRHFWLLVASFVFYLSWNVKYTLILLAVILISYSVGIAMEKHNKKRMLSAGIISLLCILLFFRFSSIWLEALSLLWQNESLGAATLIAPIGLSFFTLTAIGYLVDVYRGTVLCEKDFFKFALFLSFFPNVLSGPIERSTNLLKQIQEGVSFSYEKVKKGLLMIFWGYFLKLLIANRLSVLVNNIFEDYTNQTGFTVLFALLLYGLQLYADFSGYSYIALGIGHTLGYSLLENFRQPYFSRSIKELWKRWHISLTSWFMDYVYIPLGGSRCSKTRRSLNLIITFAVSGLWHGTGLHYFFWGVMNSFYLIIGKCFSPQKKQKSESKNVFIRILQALWTYALFEFAVLFFRADSVSQAIDMLLHILFSFDFADVLTDKPILIGCSLERFLTIVAAMLLWFIVELIHEKQQSVQAWLNARKLVIRWTIYFVFALLLIIGILYDYGLGASNFIYTQF